ncbi:MAG: M23 family metallopeptidase [Candidatus Pacebacteria bacterium]|nr:M23 family metallopeptidase [Candidatus Paceibacterota bacterium]
MLLNNGYFSENQLFLQEKNIANLAVISPIVLSGNTFKESSAITAVQEKSFAVLSFDQQEIEQGEIIEYVVKSGESFSLIAQKFGISVNTILWSNDLTNNSTISPGQKLTILPINGLTHLVRSGETASELAGFYKTDVSEIIDFNDLSNEGEIFAGDLLIIPNGKKPAKTAINYSAPLASSYFICPISSPCGITQGLHWYNAVDFSNGSCGEPIFAAAGGEVQKTGYHKTAGNYVRIVHPNKVVTFYGHLSRILVKPGQAVSQGGIIGYVGNTGYTIGATGCHIHFEVRGAKNPFGY